MTMMSKTIMLLYLLLELNHCQEMMVTLLNAVEEMLLNSLNFEGTRNTTETKIKSFFFKCMKIEIKNINRKKTATNCLQLQRHSNGLENKIFVSRVRYQTKYDSFDA